jgi:RNA polymerase sigma factor (sigma-70 family)
LRGKNNPPYPRILLSKCRQADEGQLASADEFKLDSAAVAALYAAHGEELRRFLIGLLRDTHLAADVFQTTFAKAAETGHTARRESLKSWLFTVAYHEAMLVRRRETTGQRAIAERVIRHSLDKPAFKPDFGLVSKEIINRVRQALDELPADQAEVVRRRMFRDQKFKDIAEDLKLPLGTVLTRMRLALARLRKSLKPDD